MEKLKPVKSGTGRYIERILALCVLLCAFSCCSGLNAEAESLREHFTVWCDEPGVPDPLPVALVYSNEGGVMADGALAFLPLKDFLQWEYNAPVVTVKDGSLYHVDYDSGFFDVFTEYASFYESAGENYARMNREDGEPVRLEDLQPGDYIMAINIHAEKGREYYTGASFIRIVIPDGTQSAGTLPTWTPEMTLAPTPEIPAP